MLKEEQAAELLRRCEQLAGRELKQVRGNLRNASTRAAAVWEMLVVDAATRLGQVQYESPEGGPDIRLEMPTGRWVWIEVAYLYPRYWRDQERSNSVTSWVSRHAATLLGAKSSRVSCQIYGDSQNPAGPVLKLPADHEKAKFLSSQEVTDFFSRIADLPEEPQEVRLPAHTVTLVYRPRGAMVPEVRSRPIQEAPKTAKEHAVFRVIRAKRKQHDLEGPRLVCIGSDVSPALSGMRSWNTVPVEQAVRSAFRRASALSGALVIRIASRSAILEPLTTTATATIYKNEASRNPLDPRELDYLRRLNFNHWRFSFSALTPREPKHNEHQRRVTGQLSFAFGIMNIKVAIPAPLLMDAIAGRGSLLEAYPDLKNEQYARCLRDGWSVVDCSYLPGNLELGEAPSVVLELAPPFAPVFWPPKAK